MTKYQDKSKEELINELEELNQRYDSLKASFDDYIDQRKQTEAALKDSENLFSLFMQFSPVYTYIKEVSPAESRVLFCSDNFIDMTGIPSSEMKGKTMHELFPDGFAAKMSQDDWEVVSNGNLLQIEETLNNRHYTTIKFPIKRNGKALLAGYTIDITEHKRAEKLLKDIIDNNPISIQIVDTEGFTLQGNPAFLHLFGSIPPPDFSIFDDLRSKSSELEELILQAKSGKVVHLPHVYYNPHNVSPDFPDIPRWISALIFPLMDTNGKPERFVFMHENITERKLAEEAMIESEKKFRNIFENSIVGNTLTYLNGDLIANPSFCEIVGYSQEELSKLKWQSLTHPDDIARDEEIVNSILSGEKSHGTWEKRYLKKNGDIVWVDISTTLQRDKEGKPLYFITSVKDNTERKLTGEKIREKDIQFRKLSSNVSDLIFQFTRRTDGSYHVPIASEGIKNIFGCSAEDVLEDFTPIANVIYPEDMERVIADIEYSAEHLTYFTCEFRVKIPGKPIQWIYSKSSPEKLPDGSITWYGFNADITMRKQAEEELIIAKEHAEESDRLKSAFLANMSHEIRTPMNGILGFAELLKKPELTGEQQQKYISIIEKSGARMLNIINDIVDISRIEARQMKLDLKESNINEQIEYIYTFFKPEVEGKGIKLFYKNTLPTKEATLTTDREKLYAILTNLVKNAVKYTKEGSIEFGYEKKEEYIEFYVKDTGIGIPKDRQDVIFERFIQADISDKMARQGAGLGLTITKSYIEMLGGNIWVESEEGKGSTFFFTLPFNFELSRSITINNANQKKSVGIENKQISSGLKILIAEDDETSIMLLTALVERWSREILKVRNGPEIVETCYKHPDIDLILMDVQMPGMSGFEATRRIREFDKDVVIIAQTAYGLSGDREKAIGSGCNDYISKPINSKLFNELLQKYFP